MSIKIDKVELAQKINALEGLDNETKAQLLELLHDRKKYGLVWEDKPEDVEERLREELPVLVEDKSKAIISDDKDAPNHILIEGDNLEALTSLSYTHEGKIDVIYIDPPYNSRQYCDAYHLLENVACWEKPAVEGMAKKMDRRNLKNKAA